MKPGYLILATGEIFEGQMPSWQQSFFSGEIVFNTSMVGYVEALTDPSYSGQLLTFSYPLIGNYGVHGAWESDRIQAAGMICSSLSDHADHHLATQSLLTCLETAGVPLLTGVDTRALVKTLRSQGVVLGAISDRPEVAAPFVDINQENLVAKVSCDEVITYGEGEKTIVVVDCGVKHNILRDLRQLPVSIKQVPFDYDYSDESFDGVFISNGPGDPAQCQTTIAILRKAMAKGKPMFGICLGSQLMALSVGASTYKLPFGHRAQNHPCMELATERCFLTSQNHGFAIERDSLPPDWDVTFVNLNDQTVQGIAHRDKPFFSVQFHPEAGPGPEDTKWLFETFYALL